MVVGPTPDPKDPGASAPYPRLKSQLREEQLPGRRDAAALLHSVESSSPNSSRTRLVSGSGGQKISWRVPTPYAADYFVGRKRP